MATLSVQPLQNQPILSPKVITNPVQPQLAPKVVTKPVQPVLAPRVVAQPVQPQLVPQVAAPPVPQLNVDNSPRFIKLGEVVKQKYPGVYDTMDSGELGKVVAAKYPGIYDSFIDPAVQPDNTPKVGLGKQIIQSLASPFLRLGATAEALSTSKYLGGKGSDNSPKPSALGDIKPITSVKDAAGVGLELASYAVGGEGAANALTKTGIGALKKVGTAALTQAGAGGLSGLGQSLQREDTSLKNSLTDTGKGIGFGALFGAGTGTLGLGASKLSGKVISSIEDTLNIVRKPLSKSEEAIAKAEGRASLQGFSRKVVVNPSNEDIAVAKASQGIVSLKNNAFENINKLQTAINNSSVKIRAGLENSEAIWNKNELKGVLNKVEKPITVKSDKTLSNQAANFQKALLKLSEQSDKKTVGLLDLRQDFDALVRREFPNLYDREMTPTRQYIQNLREALNSYTAKKIPSGKLPDGTLFRDELRKQHYLIKAIDNIAEKSPKEGSTAFKRFVKNNPNKLKALKYGATLLGGGVIGKEILK